MNDTGKLYMFRCNQGKHKSKGRLELVELEYKITGVIKTVRDLCGDV